jgi:hypothetical protein
MTGEMHMVKKRIMILSLTLLCSTLVKVTGTVGETILEQANLASSQTQEETKTSLEKQAEKVIGSKSGRLGKFETVMDGLRAALESEALSAEGKKIIAKELSEHELLSGLEVKKLGTHVSETLEAQSLFSPDQVLEILADCRDPHNRSAVLKEALNNIFNKTADLLSKAAAASNADERNLLTEKSTKLADIEKNLSAAQDYIIAAGPAVRVVAPEDFKLFDRIPCSSRTVNVLVGAAAVITGGAIGYGAYLATKAV